LKRTIQRELQDPLALKILSGEFHEGDTIRVERGKEGLTFNTAILSK
jgi:ATP-dependent Clp protease ATP-binding subunit ClpB